MRKLPPILAVAMVAFLCATGPAKAQRKGEAGKFDYYVLSLSWEPAYCAKAAEKGEADPDQCASDRKLGFAVHGLWPQYKDGGYPAGCSRDRVVPKAVIDQTMPIMPSVGLMVYEWQKHGTCSGLPVTDYFARLRAAYAKVTIPDAVKTPSPTLAVPATQVERLLVQANPGLTPEAVAMTCAKDRVAEVRICLNKDLGFTACGAKVVDRCRRDATLSAPAR